LNDGELGFKSFESLAIIAKQACWVLSNKEPSTELVIIGYIPVQQKMLLGPGKA